MNRLLSDTLRPDKRADTRLQVCGARRILLCAIIGCLLFGMRPLALAQRAKVEKPPLPDGGAGSSPQADAAPDASRFRRFIAQTLHYRERQQRRLLDRAADDLKNGRTVDGLRALQRVLDLSQDRFDWPTNRTAPIGLRYQADRILETLDAAGRETYERLYGFEANRLAEAAVRDGDVTQLRRIVQRFQHTAAGFNSAHRLALLAFDRGEFERAADIWNWLIRVPTHRDRMTPRMRLQLAVALRKSGRLRAAERIARQFGAARLRIGGRTTTAGRFLEADVPAIGHSDWRLPQGNAQRNRTAGASVPYPQPLWTLEYSSGESAIARTAADWRQHQRVTGRSTAVVNSPLVVGGSILLRDFDSVKSIDAQTGRVNWSLATSTKLSAELKDGGRPAGGRSPFAARELTPEFGRDYAGNSLLQSLTSDGQRVYFVDDVSLSLPGRAREGRFGPMFGRRRRAFRRMPAVEPVLPWNRLVAVNLAAKRGSKPTALWSLGRPAEEAKPGATPGPFAGHFFLGPPLPAMGRLFVLSEHKLQLSLLCLQPRTGKLEWSQPLAMSDRSVAEDHFRFTRSCTPALADGVLICPTRTGLLIAVDPLTGTLKWAAYCGTDTDEIPLAELAIVDRVPRGHVGFRSLPLIHNGRVLYLPPQSNSLFCFDLQSGRTLWKTPRDDLEFVAAADDQTVLVAGRRYARGLSPQDGRVLWQTFTGTPSGRGLASGTQYLLPVENGRVLSLHRRTGRLAGFGLPGISLLQNSGDSPGLAAARGQWQPGNLIPTGDGILSAEADRLRMFPSARRQFELAEQHLKSGNSSLAALHRAAELAALVGEFEKAGRWLNAVLRRVAAGSTPADIQRRVSAQTLLRELLFARLESGGDDPAKLLPKLERLAVSPADRGRYLIRKAEIDLLRRNGRDLLATVEEFCRLESQQLIPLPGRESHLVSAAAWAPAILDRARRTGDGSLISTIGRDESARRQRALDSQGTDALERYLRLYGNWPQSGPVRNELARRLIRAGSDQRAELLLLAGRASGNRATAAAATELLFRLWSEHGLRDRAAELLADLKGPFAKVTLSDGRTTGAQFAKRALRNALTAAAQQRFEGTRSPVSRVSVSETFWNPGDPATANAYARFRQLFPTAPESPYDLLDLGDGVETDLAVIDRQTGASAGKISVSSRHSFPVLSRYAHAGQFLSLGSAGRLHGLSLLELHHGKPFWTTRPQGFEHRDDMLLVGPAGPTCAVFQARESLIAADPGTGRLLWQRNDLPESAGLQSDPYSGLFGDGRVLTVFGADAAQYTAYHTATGEVLRRGRLAISSRHERRLFGRLLVYVSERRGRTQLRIWDPLTDRNLLERAIHPASYMTTSTDSELLVLSPDGELLVIDVPAARIRRTFRFEPNEIRGITYLKAFRSGKRLFVNVQRPVRAEGGRYFSFYAGDAFGRTEHVRGEMYAFDMDAGRRIWSRRLPQRTVLLPRTGELPVLILLSRIRDRSRGTRAALLVETLDASTGMTVGLRDDLLPDRILHLSFDPSNNTVELRGIQNRIRLKLHPRNVRGRHDPVDL